VLPNFCVHPNANLKQIVLKRNNYGFERCFNLLDLLMIFGGPTMRQRLTDSRIMENSREIVMELASIENARHYVWGDDCDGWHLVSTQNLSVIQERVPSGCSEICHLHQFTEQFFFVLSGIATIETEKGKFLLQPHQGLYVPPNTLHQLKNEQDVDLLFTVTSTPPSHGDRINQ